MKKISTLLLLILSSFVLFAQENSIEKNIRELRNPNQKYDIFQNEILGPHRQGEKIWVNDSIIYFNYAGDDQWTPRRLYKVMTRNGYGSNTSGIEVRFDSDLSEWVPYHKDKTVYYFNNTKKSYLEKLWNKETNSYSDTSVYYIYNGSGDIVKSVIGGGYIGKCLYSYDENGNKTLAQCYRKDSYDDSFWRLVHTYELTYNEEGMLIIYEHHYFSRHGINDDIKYIFTIVDGLITEIDNPRWNEGTKSWDVDAKWFYYYNDLNQNDSRIKKYFRSGEWVNSDKYVYSYNSKGEYSSFYKYNWDSVWVNNQKETYTYINDEYLTDLSKFYWSIDSLRWEIYSKEAYTYDDNFNRLSYTRYRVKYKGVFDKYLLTVYSWSEFEVSGIEENNYSKIDIFPNPVKDYFTIDCEKVDKIKDVNIYSLQGKPVKSLHKIRDKVIDIQDLKKGIYIIEVNTIKGKKYNKIIKY